MSRESVEAGSTVNCSASPEHLWSLIACPDQWHRWSPYVRGAEGLGAPEVEAGSHGKVVLAGGIRLPASILEVIPGHSWSWQVGGLVIDHVVTEAPGGSRLAMPVRSKGRLWRPAAIVYGLPVRVIARRVVAIAEDDVSP